MYSHDNRVVITLDAGGTNLVFGAMQANKFIVEPITLAFFLCYFVCDDFLSGVA